MTISRASMAKQISRPPMKIKTQKKKKKVKKNG